MFVLTFPAEVWRSMQICYFDFVQHNIFLLFYFLDTIILFTSVGCSFFCICSYVIMIPCTILDPKRYDSLELLLICFIIIQNWILCMLASCNKFTHLAARRPYIWVFYLEMYPGGISYICSFIAELWFYR